MSDDTVKTMNSLQKARENKVVKSSEMVQKGKFYLSLMESKALNYLVSKIKPGDDINTEYCFNCNEFQSIIHRSIVSEKNSYTNTKSTLQSISDKGWWIRLEDGKEAYVHWLNVIHLDPGTGDVIIKFHEDMFPYLYNLSTGDKKYYIAPRLEETSLMTHKYSPRIYELIRTYLNNVSSLDEVGLYNVGFVITMTYAGMIFSAMESDYFPRLSAVNNDRAKCRDLISKQAEVSLLLISPIVVAAIFLLPIALPLLTSEKFLPVVDMMRLMSLALYLRAVNLSLEYLSLAKGASLSYLFLEGVYDLLIVVLTIVGYIYFGLTGTGIALLVAGLFNTLLVMGYIGLKFGVFVRKTIFLLLLIQLAIGATAFFATQWLSGWPYWLSGILLFIVSLSISVNILRRKTHLWDKIKAKIHKKLQK